MRYVELDMGNELTGARPPSPQEQITSLQAEVAILRGENKTLTEQRDLAIKQRDIAETRAKIAEGSAKTDGLTGLENRRSFDEEFERAVASAFRTGDTLAFILMDGDRFKQLNDEFGHRAGDEALRTLGRTAIDTLRDTDRAARYGGEEVALILPATPLDGALIAAEKVREAVKTNGVSHDGKNIKLTVSLGVAYLDPKDWDTSTVEKMLEAIEEAKKLLMEQADQALYAAKKEGRNRTGFVENGRIGIARIDHGLNNRIVKKYHGEFKPPERTEQGIPKPPVYDDYYLLLWLRNYYPTPDKLDAPPRLRPDGTPYSLEEHVEETRQTAVEVVKLRRLQDSEEKLIGFLMNFISRGDQQQLKKKPVSEEVTEPTAPIENPNDPRAWGLTDIEEPKMEKKPSPTDPNNPDEWI